MSHGRDSSPKPFAVVAEFANSDELLRAVEKTKEAGYRDIEAYSPVPIYGLAEAMDFKDNRLWLLCFGGGLTGAIGGMLLEWYTSASPFNWPGIPAPTGMNPYTHMVGGKPLFSLPAFVPVAYECTILLAAFGAMFGMFALNGLPKPHHPVFNAESFKRASQDRYIMTVESTDPRYDEVELEAFFRTLAPISVEAIKTSEGY